MPLNATTVIDQARGLDESFTPRAHPSRVLYEFLTRYQQELAGEMLARERESISAEIEISLPLADFDAGAALITDEGPPPVAIEYERIHDVSLWDAQGNEYPLWVVPYKQRYSAADRWPTAWLRETTLFLNGRESEYAGFTKILFVYAPTPGTVDNENPTMILPSTALSVVTLALGAEMCRRKPELCARTSLPGEHIDAEARFLQKIEDRNNIEVGKVRRVFS